MNQLTANLLTRRKLTADMPNEFEVTAIKLIFAVLGLTVAGFAAAKLPPLDDEAKARLAEIKHKAAWSEKIAAYHLCLAQDRVANRYLENNGKPKPELDMPECTEPGPYVAAQVSTTSVGVADSKPVPEVGAVK